MRDRNLDRDPPARASECEPDSAGLRDAECDILAIHEHRLAIGCVVAITNTISLTTWQDVVSGSTGNLTAEQEIQALARADELLVEDEGKFFVPIPTKGSWSLVQVFTEGQIAAALGVAVHDMHRLLLEADVPAFRSKTRLFSVEKLWSWEGLKTTMEVYVAAHGMEAREAALHLGLTRYSYERLIGEVPFNVDGRVNDDLLDGYRNRFLPKDKVWGTRTSLLREFVVNFNAANPQRKIELQLCEVDDCEHAASDQCANPRCRENDPPRFVCPAHANWVDGSHIARRPRSLCPTCTKKVPSGELRGFQLL